MDNLTLGLGASGLCGVILLAIGWFVARGVRSKCIVGGNVVSLDVHKATPNELNNITAVREAETPGVVAPPLEPEQITVIEHHPQLHPIRVPVTKTPKVSRNSHTSKTPATH